ncbi:MAG: hypothetical protein ACRYGR_08315 [Janthinobacterium lividum]
MKSLADALVESGGKWDRVSADHYPTPPDVTQALVDWLKQIGRWDDFGSIYEPACGEGQMARVLEQNGAVVDASDLNATGYGFQADFLSGEQNLYARASWADAVITNPPFSHAEQFIRRALEWSLCDRPFVAMVLKSAYWHAARRAKLFREHPPSWVLALTWRPAFLQETRGKSPLMEVVWVVWDPKLVDGVTFYDVLDRPKGMSDFLPPTLEVLLARAEASVVALNGVMCGGDVG